MKWPDPSKVKMSLSGMKETDYSTKKPRNAISYKS